VNEKIGNLKKWVEMKYWIDLYFVCLVEVCTVLTLLLVFMNTVSEKAKTIRK
jgi:hypothetical protein